MKTPIWKKLIRVLLPEVILKALRSFLFWQKHFLSVPNFFAKRHVIVFPQLKDVTVLIGHSSYLNSIGGTERIILEDVEELRREGKNSLFLYPLNRSQNPHLVRSPVYGVILNGCEIGHLSVSQILRLLTQLNVSEVRFHHLLNWPLFVIRNLLNTFKAKKIRTIIYAHDFYFMCPRVNGFCKNGQKVCKNLYSGSIINKWKKAYEKLMLDADDVVAPSEYIKKNLPGSVISKSAVYSPVRSQDKKFDSKPRLAYLGSATAIKGFNTWESLAKNALITRKFDLIQLGQGPSPSGIWRREEYSYSQSYANLASELLKKNSVDYVLIWSQVPESFSFTYYEAVAVGCFVIASNMSGNVAEQLTRNPNKGVVLNSEYDLIQYLLSV